MNLARALLFLILLIQSTLWSRSTSIELEASDGTALLIQIDEEGQLSSLNSSDGLVNDEAGAPSFIDTLKKYGRNLKPLKDHLKALFDFDRTWNDLGEIGSECLPEGIFFFSGFRGEQISTAVAGSFDFSDKVRFTAINGVLNDLISSRQRRNDLRLYRRSASPLHSSPF